MINLENFALGLIETVGLVAGIEAADTAVKSSNVELIGYENSKGGTVVVKVKGDVGAVNAAIQSALASAQMVNKVLSTSIIPRPNAELRGMIFTNDNVGSSLKDEKKNEKLDNNDLTTNNVEILDKGFNLKKKNNKTEAIKPSEDKVEESESSDIEKNITCNLCMDPMCSRKKGEPRTSCIHYNEIKK